ncbi:TraY domain-containing protein [uncultured Xanthomonas sp.]|uniref:TraY domain-containing protein n=1 Tax=uncultured Xanthomonas sp. TaxID=152831 RepID=UPI0025EF4A50|nr:TraY domain-containing protein [uncultured Xanthomonas sp.]
MARNDPQVNVRMSSDLKERLEEAASRSGRSLTAEIVTRLDWSLEAQLLDLVEQLQGNLERVRALSGNLETLQSEIARYESGDRSALKWLVGADGALDEADALNAARLVRDTLAERIYALRGSIATTCHSVAENGREPAYYQRTF